MRVADEIAEKLNDVFSPRELEVVDDSASHAGHAGAPDAGQSHFNVRIRAAEFAGQSRIARHRAVHAAIGADLIGRIHALAIDADG
ncbi:BolA family protein [Pseudosulfitobacter sp. DSM 107133]|jgi:BolA protein|uniref:BolA family protein n=1 Tax=Pseudosulfitobacter sp. DSM 107133 TaxID=2883100 RepID=UPI000DF29344|nr:BolA family protein [Pseudosulfitobacter sp. DSM 107133]UOA27696.1 DNA-binding transcriptional regulator BolA [Pseudosulfitobacter sp. DSM 107133]